MMLRSIARPPSRQEVCADHDGFNLGRACQSCGTLLCNGGYILPAGGPTGEDPMQDYNEIWDLAAGTFIAVSVVGGLAFIIASAIH